MRQVIVDILPRFLARDADVLRKRKLRNAVHNAEIHSLCVTAHERRDLLRLHAEDLCSR